MVVLAVKGLLWVFCLFFNLFFLSTSYYKLCPLCLILPPLWRAWARCSWWPPCRYEGAAVRSSWTFSSGWSNPAPPASPPRACAPASWPPWGSLHWAYFQFMFFLDQRPKTRHSILDTAKKYWAERNNHFPINTGYTPIKYSSGQRWLPSLPKHVAKSLFRAESNTDLFSNRLKIALTSSLYKNEVKNKSSSHLIHPLQNEPVSVFQIWTEKSANPNWYLNSESPAFNKTQKRCLFSNIAKKCWAYILFSIY